MYHQNLNNKNEINLCDFFKDDPGYTRYYNYNKNDLKNNVIVYDNSFKFECIHPS